MSQRYKDVALEPRVLGQVWRKIHGQKVLVTICSPALGEPDPTFYATQGSAYKRLKENSVPWGVSVYRPVF